MAEIVKRFNLGQEIPQTMEDKVYQYNDIEKDDGTGNIVTEEVLTNEVLNLIPITPNLDYVENVDSDDLAMKYDIATDKARSFVRGKQLEEKKNKAAKDKADYDRLAKAGLIQSSQKVETNLTPEPKVE